MHFPCSIMVAIDRDKALAWKEGAIKEHGPIELHGGRPIAKSGGTLSIGKVKTRTKYPWYDYWWQHLQTGQGTSSMLAAKIAIAIGFDEVILCGAPLDREPYLDGEDDWVHRTDRDMEVARHPWVKAKYLHPYLSSMSGWTQELLGQPTP